MDAADRLTGSTPARHGYRALATVLPLFLAFLLPRPAAAQEALPPDAATATLENGLTVLALPAGTTPMATVEVVVRGGASTQVEEAEEGLPHMLEHMLFRSYGGGGSRSFGSYAAELGAAYNGTTGNEAVTYYLTLPAENVEPAIELLADLVSNPRFRGEDLDSERDVVKDELQRNASEPGFLLETMVDMTMWGAGFRQHNPIGNLLTIQGATVDLLRTYYAEHYVPSRSALVVSGDIDPHATIRWAQESFDDWDDGGGSSGRPVAPLVPERDTVLVVEGNTSEVVLLARWQGPADAENRRAGAVADVLTTLVNQPGSGFQRKLVDTGLFRTAWLSYRRDTRGGVFSLRATTTPERLAEASRALRQEVLILSRGWAIADEEVEAALLRSEVDRLRRDQSAVATAHWAARAWARGEFGDTDDVESGPVTADDVRSFVSEWIEGRPRVMGFLTPPGLIDERLEDLVAAVQPWRQR